MTGLVAHLMLGTAASCPQAATVLAEDLSRSSDALASTGAAVLPLVLLAVVFIAIGAMTWLLGHKGSRSTARLLHAGVIAATATLAAAVLLLPSRSAFGQTGADCSGTTVTTPTSPSPAAVAQPPNSPDGIPPHATTAPVDVPPHHSLPSGGPTPVLPESPWTAALLVPSIAAGLVWLGLRRRLRDGPTSAAEFID